MHGLLIRDRRELSDEELSADHAAACAASELLQDVIRSKRSRDHTDESFQKTMKLLKLNPELALAWNYRREIIDNKPQEGKLETLKREISVLNGVMVDLQMTKSYCLWSHRRWLILQFKQLGEANKQVLDHEMLMVKTILDFDGRNFHSWSYRQWLRHSFGDLIEFNDIEYSEKLIMKDFSNYSAWFLRSWAVDNTDVVIEPEEELELVWNALFTEPNDQSCWQYHDWLLEKYPQLSDKDSEFMHDLEAVVDDIDSKYLLLSKLRRASVADKPLIVNKLVNIDPMRNGYYRDL
jgi:geranylgeranyl transferase type-2 subunit alpha